MAHSTMDPLTTPRTSPGTRRAEPLYQALENQIREKIDAGLLIPGDLIPSEPQLAEQMNVSQGTVKKAIDNLVWQGLLYRHQGKGTFVSSINLNNSLFRFFSYGDEKGHDVRVHKETTKRRLERGETDTCHQLNVKPGTQLLYIERTGYSADTPIFVEHSWWIADLVPGLENEQVHIPDLLYALIVEKYNLPIVRAEETLTARACDKPTAKLLKIKPDAPVVVLKRTTYTTGNRIVEVRTTLGRADMFSYKREIR